METMPQRIDELKQRVEDLLAEARRQGADAAEAGVGLDAGLAVTVRLGEVETVEHTRDQGLGITVYIGGRKGSASTSDLSPQALRDTAGKACAIARHMQPDPCNGLPDPERLARVIPDLDLHHPWGIDAEGAIEIARACEQAGRDLDPRIVNSEGASLNTNAGVKVCGNSAGFLAGYPSTRHGLSCALVGRQGGEMQRDYWWTSARAPEDLEAPEAVGMHAAERAVNRLGARKLDTRECPVLFQADVATSLMRAFAGAISGGNLYRQASFLLDRLGKDLFPRFVRIHEDPLRLRGAASAPFDAEGVATLPKDFVSEGVLVSYALDTYAACRLHLETTGNAGGVRNLVMEPTGEDREALLRRLDTGLLVTEMMGQGANLVTGDYSRGASGFWVEGGVIQYPVQEITIAGNLREMFAGLRAVGTDLDRRGGMHTGSWLIERMMVAGE